MESQDDKNVDGAITRMQALLDELKGAQAKDVKDESGEEASEYKSSAKTVQDAGRDYISVRAHTRARRAKETPAPGA